MAIAKNLVDVFNLPQPPVFGTSNSEIYSTLNMALSVLSSDPLSGISNTDVTALIGLASMTIPWWQATVVQGGGGLTSPVGLEDLLLAGGLS